MTVHALLASCRRAVHTSACDSMYPPPVAVPVPSRIMVVVICTTVYSLPATNAS